MATVGGAAVAGAAVLAPAWQWIDQKNEAGGILRRLVKRFAPTINGAAGLERRQLVAAAHSTIVVAAYFDVFHEAVEAAGYGGFTLTEPEKWSATAVRDDYTSLMEWLYSAEIPAPSATNGFEENTLDVEWWIDGLHGRNRTLLRSLGLRRLVEDDPDLLSASSAARRPAERPGGAGRPALAELDGPLPHRRRAVRPAEILDQLEQ